MFDRETARRMVWDTVCMLSSSYPDGALEWLRANRPDVIRYAHEAEAALDAAVEAEDVHGLALALERYVKVFQRAFQVFEGRPPVIEVQAFPSAGVAEGKAVLRSASPLPPDDRIRPIVQNGVA
uniref:Uncharacterized protein n=1 Tax=Geobacter metallireducens TaxID=28232 RepID=A0A831TXV1_GEOME